MFRLPRGADTFRASIRFERAKGPEQSGPILFWERFLVSCHMPNPLRQIDFRARRVVLTRKDFAFAPKPARRPSDIIDRETWESVVILPDDVAIRTSNYHGTTLRQLHDLWGAWVESFGSVHDCMFAVMLDAGDDFQAATYTALTGFYRLSVAALRSALELTVIGTWTQVCRKHREFRSWRSGRNALSFGQACDGLLGAAGPLEAHLGATIDDSIFAQRSSSGEGGYARRMYRGISDFSHSRPGYADGDMRQSNGPIYARSAFNHVAWVQFETFAICFVLLLLARPKQQLPPPAIQLFSGVKRVKSRATRAAFEFLYASAERK